MGGRQWLEQKGLRHSVNLPQTDIEQSAADTGGGGAWVVTATHPCCGVQMNVAYFRSFTINSQCMVSTSHCNIPSSLPTVSAHCVSLHCFLPSCMISVTVIIMKGFQPDNFGNGLGLSWPLGPLCVLVDVRCIVCTHL